MQRDIEQEEMYTGTFGENIASCVAVNGECDDAYHRPIWRYRTGKTAYVHRLCVTPEFHNIGIGTATMRVLEDVLREKGVYVIRLDAFSQNPYAIKLYEKLGYLRAGTANWRKGFFYLYEKKI